MSHDDEIKKCAEAIRNGQVVLFPTDTVVGLGCRFDSEEAIERIRAIKGIKETSPMAVLISSAAQLEDLKMRKSLYFNILSKKLWPGGLTLVITSENHYPCSGAGNTLGLRMPGSDLVRKIIELAGVPISATSANLHGKSAPRLMADVDRKILDAADCVFDLEIKSVGLPSTVVKIEAGQIRIMREGAVPAGDIMEAVAEDD